MNGDGFWAGVTAATVACMFGAIVVITMVVSASGTKYRDACLQTPACVVMVKDSNGGKLP